QVSDKLTQFESNVVLWCRFIDDIFVIWRGDEEAALQFVRDLNTNEYNLRFTEHLNPRCIEFLDVEIAVRDNKLVSKLYRKTTAGNNLLCAHSAHPGTLIRSIPFGELLRARRNCSETADFQLECEVMCERFRKRGYGAKVIDQARRKVESLNRADVLYGTKRGRVKENDSIRFITTYNNQSYKIRTI
ncbi:hypothetical protein NDU88_006330, partial [Pleurodeles waltl]